MDTPTAKGSRSGGSAGALRNTTALLESGALCGASKACGTPPCSTCIESLIGTRGLRDVIDIGATLGKKHPVYAEQWHPVDRAVLPTFIKMAWQQEKRFYDASVERESKLGAMSPGQASTFATIADAAPMRTA